MSRSYSRLWRRLITGLASTTVLRADFDAIDHVVQESFRARHAPRRRPQIRPGKFLYAGGVLILASRAALGRLPAIP